MSLRGTDLNLVPILQALLREGSVSRAAKLVGLSQPATSHALGRLRHLFGDPLLVKVGREMRLTAKAEKLRQMADTACSAFDALLATEGFDPFTAKGTLRVATTDHMALVLARDLLPILRTQAPNLSVGFVDAGFSVHDQILSNSVDLAAIARVPGGNASLSIEGGYFDPLVCACARDHPMAGKNEITLDELAGFPLLQIDSVPDFRIPPSHQSMIEPVRVAASHLMVLPLLAAKTSAITVIPRSMANLAAEHATLAIIPLLGDLRPLEHCLIWNPIHDSDPAHGWLRAKLNGILAAHFPAVGL